MKAVIQRVSQSSVTIDNKIVAEIQKGLLVLIGIEEADNQEDSVWLTSKIANLRIFADENQYFESTLGGTWAPYALCASSKTKNVGAPAHGGLVNTLSYFKSLRLFLFFKK